MTGAKVQRTANPLSASERAKAKESGAALIIVLLLAATLSFILLSITDRMSAGLRRASAERDRSQLIWRGFAAEQAARSILEIAEEQGLLDKTSLGEGMFAQQFALPAEHGSGALRFADATRCFNVNSVVAGSPGDYARNDAGAAELIALATAIGFGAGDAERLAAVIVDWIDTDNSQEIGGAEDNFYAALPTPYRTGGTLLASVSELRAMDGITAEAYQEIAPYLCARPDTNPTVVNVNMLRPQDAPIIAAMLGGAIPLPGIADAISNRPPGGYTEALSFWAEPAFAGQPAAAERTAVSSAFIEARALLEVNQSDMEEALLFRMPEDGPPQLIFRAFGADR